MSGYIVDPMLFYLINIINNINFLLEIMLIVLSIFCVCYYLSKARGMISIHDSYLTEGQKIRKRQHNFAVEKYNQKLFFKIFKIVFVVISLDMVVIALIPSQDTMYKMLVAKYATYENVQAIDEQISGHLDKAIDKITDAAIKIKNGSENNKN